MIDPPADSPGDPARKKAMVYVDGFNLYFGILQGTPNLKWLNLESFMDFSGRTKRFSECATSRHWSILKNIFRSPEIDKNAIFKLLAPARSSR